VIEQAPGTDEARGSDHDKCEAAEDESEAVVAPERSRQPFEVQPRDPSPRQAFIRSPQIARIISRRAFSHSQGRSASSSRPRTNAPKPARKWVGETHYFLPQKIRPPATTSLHYNDVARRTRILPFSSYKRYLNFPPSLVWQVYDLPKWTDEGRRLAEEHDEKQLEFTRNWEDASGADLLLVSGALHFFDPPVYYMAPTFRKSQYMSLSTAAR
jgi:hypothetical protein